MKISPFLVVAGAAAFSLMSVGAKADFFESLFGAAPAPAPAVAAAPAEPARKAIHRSRRRAVVEIHERHHRGQFKVAATEPAPKITDSPRQKTTGLMDDRTLRAGDAVMTRDGLRIFAGDEADHHEPHDFVPLGAARHERKNVRVALLAIDDAARLDIGRVRSDLQAGRSVSVLVERRPSFTNANATVRYVGP